MEKVGMTGRSAQGKEVLRATLLLSMSSKARHAFCYSKNVFKVKAEPLFHYIVKHCISEPSKRLFLRRLRD